MRWSTRATMVAMAAIAIVAIAGCGSSSSSSNDDEFALEGSAAVAPAAPAFAVAENTRSSAGSNRLESQGFVAPAAPVAAAAPAPARAAIGVAAESALPQPQIADLAVQQRIIVRTVDMSITVSDIAGSIDTIGAMATELGGWVVSTNRSQKHRGFVSIRVPADDLDGAISRLRAMAVEVESEITTSRDVTDEYVDIDSRLKTLRATEESLLGLMRTARTVEDTLKVQESLTRTQEQIEQLEGRIKFLEQTSAFSLISVALGLEPADMMTDAGEDQSTGLGQPVRFRASFKPPEGIEDFFFTWDFGDGSPVITSDRTAPTEDEDTRVTATITHSYHDEKDSPFIAQIEITGTGESGVAEGEDTLMVTVSRIPVIEVFAGDRVVVEEGQKAEFSGSFTRPEGLSKVRYTWDFGDGSTAETGDLGEGVTTAVATHVYQDHRPFDFRATLTVSAESEAGDIEGTHSVSVRVTEGEGWTIAGWDPNDQGKTAVRALSAVGAGVVTVLIWGAIFSPLWGGVGYLGFIGFRRLRSRRRSS